MSSSRRRITIVITIVLAIGLMMAGLSTMQTTPAQSIKAAIVNLDDPVEVDGQTVPLGRQLSAELIEQDSVFDWEITTESLAQTGLNDGTYTAIVSIPEDFSSAATSMSTPEDMVQAKIDVQVRPGATEEQEIAVSSVTAAASNALGRQLSETFVTQTISGLSTMQTQLSQAADGARQLATGASSLDSGMTELVSGSQQIDTGIKAAATGVSELNSGTSQLASGADTAANGMMQLSTGTEQLVGGSQQLATGAQGIADGVSELYVALDAVTTQVGQSSISPSQIEMLTKYQEAVSTILSLLNGQYPAASTDLSSLTEGETDSIPSNEASLEDSEEYLTASSLETQISDYTSFIHTQCDTTVSENTDQEICSEENLAALESIESLSAENTALQTANSSVQSQTGTMPTPEQIQQLQKELENFDLTTMFTSAQKQMSDLHTALQTITNKVGGESTDPNNPSLTDATQQLATGLATMSTESQQLSSGMAQASSGTGQLATGLSELSVGTDTASTGINALSKSFGDFVSGTEKISEGTDQVATGTLDLANGLQTASQQIPSYSDQQIENMANVVAQPIATPNVNSSLSQQGAAVLTLLLWLFTFILLIIFPPFVPYAVNSVQAPFVLAIRAWLKPAFLSAVTGIIAGLVLANWAETNFETSLGLALLTALIGVVFSTTQQALAAALGLLGRILSLLGLALAVIAALPALASSGVVFLTNLAPTGQATLAINSFLIPQISIGQSAFVGLIAWAIISFAITIWATSRRRSKPTKAVMQAQMN